MRRRVVDATYLSPTIPATTPPPFGVADGVRVVPVNELGDVADAPSELRDRRSGKTATDAIVWLLRNGVDPDRIVWVRPRDPWMLNRARRPTRPGGGARARGRHHGGGRRRRRRSTTCSCASRPLA